ncbi:MAG: hypothetical protein ABSB78_13015 [Bacteroidota bacterium]
MKVNYALMSLFLFLNLPSVVSSQGINDVKPCINFIYLPDAKGELVPNGTGFFIGVTDTVRRITFVYIVTAKHVLWDSTTKTFVPYGWLRLNRKGGDAAFVRFTMNTSGAMKNVFIHPDTTVDLVVIQGLPDQEKYDFDVFPSQLIRTTDDLKRIGLGEGSDVFIPALFLPHIGEHQNYPIVRFGKLALLSGGERIKWGDQMQRLHLIESISIGGHSGAPVFVWFEPRHKQGDLISYEEKLIRLIGVMQGYFGEVRSIGIIKTSVTPVYESNTGISAVVPVDLLNEILFGIEMTKARIEQ